jgi:uncharacterized protein (TIGR02598 family)
MRIPPKAFSLVEIVVALGIFSFCIVAILGMLPVGMRAARGVADESNAVNIASSIFGLWEIAPAGTPLFPTNIFVNTGPSINVGQPNNVTVYFDDEGRIVPSAQSASLNMTYSATQTNIPGNPTAINYSVNLVFRWPPTAPDNVAQVRVFSDMFAK